MKKMQKMPKEGKGVKEKKRKISAKSIYCFYCGLIYTATIIVCSISLFLAAKPNETYTYLIYVPPCLWLFVLSFIFFETVNIVYLRISYDYWLLAKKVKEHGYWEDFRTLCIVTGVLVVVSIIRFTSYISLMAAIVPILAGLVITRIIRFVRLRYYQN